MMTRRQQIAIWLSREVFRFASAREGAMGILGAFSVVILIAVSVLALEASMLFVKKGDMQRVADLANLAAANTDSAIVNGAASAQAVATAQQIAVINGYPSTILSTGVTTSSSQGQLLTTTVVDPIALTLGQIFTRTGSVSVRALSSASIASGTTSGDCLRSLVSYVNIFSSASVSGTGCTIASASYLYYCSSRQTTVSAIEVGWSALFAKPYVCYNAPLTPAAGSFTFSKTSTDPLSSDSRITTMKSRLQGMSSWAYSSTFKSPLTPAAVSGGADQTYTNKSSATANASKYGNITLTNSTVTFTGSGTADLTCSNPVTINGNVTLSGTSTMILGSGCYSIRGVLSISNGAVANIVPASGATVTLALQQYLYNGNGSITFGNMLFSAVGIINNGNGGNVTFGNGPFYLGGGVYNTSGTATFGNGPFYFKSGTINNVSSGTMTFGDGPFYFYYSPLYNARGVVTFGAGDFEFYVSSITTSTGSKTTFGKGNMNLYSTSAYLAGSEFTIGGAGDASAGSSSMFFYLSSLQIAAGKFTANGVSMGFWYGMFTLSSSGAATITAPTSASPTYGYQNILSYTYGSSFNIYQSAVTDSLSGVIYNPANDVNFFGQQTSTIPTGGCFAVIAGWIAIYSSSTHAMKACGSGTQNSQAVMAN
jgi:Flp pilus assembly protein TadG